jgi:hypothetical protein
MLRITVRHQPDRTTLTLEGRLLGPWVDALEEDWLATLRLGDPRPIVADLTEVTFVDPAGRELLTRMSARGTRLVATGIESGAVVVEIARDAERRRELQDDDVRQPCARIPDGDREVLRTPPDAKPR